VVLGGVFTLGETDYVKATDMSENVAGDFGRFATGTEVWWRSIVDERVGYTIPTTVLVDNEVRVALLQRHGCICKRRRGLRGGLRGRVLSAQDWDGGHVDRLWKGPDSIRLWPVGASFSVIRNWNSQQRCLSGWYGNLEQPWTRRGNGFDTRDLILDVQIEDDLSGWILKDEDELAAAEDVGLTVPLTNVERPGADTSSASLCGRGVGIRRKSGPPSVAVLSRPGGPFVGTGCGRFCGTMGRMLPDATNTKR
jgi:hypothetical protein